MSVHLVIQVSSVSFVGFIFSFSLPLSPLPFLPLLSPSPHSSLPLPFSSVEPRALCIVIGHCAPELHPQPSSVLGSWLTRLKCAGVEWHWWARAEPPALPGLGCLLCGGPCFPQALRKLALSLSGRLLSLDELPSCDLGAVPVNLSSLLTLLLTFSSEFPFLPAPHLVASLCPDASQCFLTQFNSTWWVFFYPSEASWAVPEMKLWIK